MTTNFDRFKIFLLNKQEQRVTQIDDFNSFKGTVLYNDVGTWTMEIDRSSNYLVELTTPMYGIDVYDTVVGASFMRGLIDQRGQKYDATTDTLTLSGWDDNQWLNWRLAHPSPSESLPPYTAQNYDVRTGVASQIICDYFNINAGGTAITPRQITNTSSINASIGGTITGRARWEVLLPFLQDLALKASTEVGFTIGHDPISGLKQFRTYAPVDRTETVKFSVALGNLVGGEIKSTSPKATYVFAAGSGDLAARVYHESYDPAAQSTWGRREYFYDVNNLSADAELAQAAQKALLEQGEQAEFAVQITDTDSLTYGVDYGLGDKVTAVFVGSETLPIVGTDAGVVQEMIRKVELSITADDVRVTPTIGTPDKKDVFRIFRQIRQLRAQIQQRQHN